MSAANFEIADDWFHNFQVLILDFLRINNRGTAQIADAACNSIGCLAWKNKTVGIV